MRTLKFGIIGSGGWADMHSSLLQQMDGVVVAAFCGSGPGRADALAAKYGARAYSCLQEMLEKEGLDAAIVCVPPYARGAYERELVAAGVPMFVEKPLGIRLEEAEEVAAAVAAKGLLTSVGYHWRYLPSVSRAKQLLQGQRIGMANCHWYSDFLLKPAWWRAHALSGGQMNEQTSHIIDALRYLAGEIVEVYAAYNLLEMHKIENADIPDVGAVTVKYANGAVGTFANSLMVKAYRETGLKIVSTDYVIDVRYNDIAFSKDAVETKQAFHAAGNPYMDELQGFVHALRTGDRSRILSTYEDALNTFRVTVACGESARTGLPVKIAQTGLST